MRRYNRSKRHNLINYINPSNGHIKDINKKIGWVIRNNKWWADYADKLEWYQMDYGYCMQIYIKEKLS
jgi:hypothetical protein